MYRFFITILVCMAFYDSFAQDVVRNDKVYKVALRNTYGYRLRTNDTRYEGLYAAEVSKPQLDLVSVTEGSVQYGLKPLERVQIKAPRIKKYKEISVAGASFSLSKYYRLDMKLSSEKFRNIPLGEVISPNYIRAANLGIYGYVGNPENPAVYIPVKIISSVGDTTNKIQLIFISNIDVPTLRWRKALSYSNTCTEYTDWSYIQSAAPFYPAGQPMVIQLDKETNSEKEYCLSIEIKPKGQSSWVSREYKILIVK
jgi:hypothetical protein